MQMIWESKSQKNKSDLSNLFIPAPSNQEMAQWYIISDPINIAKIGILKISGVVE